MMYRRRYCPARTVNLVLSGGGVKGIAYVGVLRAAEENGYCLGNIAGVSAGALAGAIAGAGYSSCEMNRIMNEFDFEKVKIENTQKMTPVVSRFMVYSKEKNIDINRASVHDFLGRCTYNVSEEKTSRNHEDSEINMARADNINQYTRSIMANIVKFSKEGCLFDGDYIEEWVSRVLAARGIRTFKDLRYGMPDSTNPMGYKVRMTAVDANRAKIIILPDDLAYYGIEPDKFEVAKAVRMSISVPFAFKPVELKRFQGNFYKIHYIVDGGVLDNFPYWLISSCSPAVTLGFKLDGGDNKKHFSMSSPLNILKGIISSIHNIGKPDDKNIPEYIASIDTSKVPFMDFSLNKEEKMYLVNEGRKSALTLFSSLPRYRNVRIPGFVYVFRRMFRYPFY